jgi:hypothetical protein
MAHSSRMKEININHSMQLLTLPNDNFTLLNAELND